MDLLQVSRIQLINEAYECKKMMYRLINLPKHAQSYISPSLLPYLSLICDGIDTLFQSNNTVWSSEFEDINEISFTKLIRRTRASSKLLTDKKINHSLNILEKEIINFSHHLKRDYSKVQLAYVNMFGQEDLGIYYYKNKPFANTSQLILYVKPFNSEIDRVGNYIYKFGTQASSYISSFLYIFEDYFLEELRQEDYKIKLDENDFEHKDYIFSVEKHRNVFNDEIDKNISLFLLNMQCQLNFSLDILDLLIDDHPLKFRIQFLIYYYSVQALKYTFGSNLSKLNNHHKNSIEKIIITQSKIFESGTFRNNLFHYKLSGENIQFINNDYFKNMVEEETYTSFDDLLSTIHNETHNIENLIRSLIY